MSSRCPSQVPSSSGTSTWTSRQSSSYEQTGSCMSSRDNDFLFPSPSPFFPTPLSMLIGSFNLTSSFPRSPHVYLYQDKPKLLCS